MKYPKKIVAALLAAIGVAASGTAQAAGDPTLDWKTLRAPHARIHFYKGCEPMAQRIADLIEKLQERMPRELGWTPDQTLEIVLTDNTDDANGSATAVPYNIIRLYITGPDDMSALGDYDDWYLELLSHEYTHILHADHVTGVPAIINSIIGKTFVPNQALPRWTLEGLAVINESRHSTAGRMRSSMFDMYMRGDVIENRLMGLDQMSNSPHRWPQGNVWYLYGSRFLGWIADTYGFDTLAAIAADTSSQLIPYGLNRTVRRFTGRTYEELYEGWSDYLKRHYEEQLAPVRARGLREGTRLTQHGEMVGRPRFVPQVARAQAGYGELLYYRADNRDRSGFYRLTLETPDRVKANSVDLYARTAGMGSASFAPDGALYLNSNEPWRTVYSYNDIVRIAPKEGGAPSGFEASRQRLTNGMRAQDPDVSPDGRHLVYTVNHRGTTFLKYAQLAPEGGLQNARTLVPSARYEQAYTPRFSPDGRYVAYSAWTQGGYRDIRIVDLQDGDGTFRELMHDRAVDMQPSFSADGKYLLFSSDRTGIANIYAYSLATGRLQMVTNVLLGAYQPELSPDGKTLVYVGYTSFGYDLFSIPFDESRFLAAPEYVPDRLPVHAPAPRTDFEVVPYNPLPSLRPRSLSYQYGPGTYGQALTLRADGSDAVGHHFVSASATMETEELLPYASLSYMYGRLPFNLTSTAFRAVSPRKGYRVNDEEPIWLERTIGWNNSIGYTIPGTFDAQSVSLGYSVASSEGNLPTTRTPDPYSQTTIDPLRGVMGVVHMGWAYNRIEGYLHSVGARRGFFLGAAMDMANDYTASQRSIYAFSYQANKYIPMPWGSQHTVALHAGGATATGDYPKRGLYYVGGFADSTINDVINNLVYQSGYVLRGYQPFAFIGSQYHLFNAEYRFPIATIDRGPSTLPVFLQRLNGNLFLDYGGSFNQLDTKNWRDQFHTGIGAELWAELQIAYGLTFNIRLGYAKGYGQFAQEGGQKYMIVAAPF